MQIVFNKEEEQAINRFAIRKKITYQEAMKEIIDAMTKGLVELARKDDIDIAREQFEKATTKIETLDIDASDSDSD